MAQDSSEILGRVSNLEQDDSSRDIYDDWSQHYDDHLLTEFGYISPDVAAAELARHLQQHDLEIIDFGCGTGLVGVALSEQGFVNVDGVDISTGMLEQARSKQVYRNLSPTPNYSGYGLLDVHSYWPGFVMDGHQGSSDVAQGRERWLDGPWHWHPDKQLLRVGLERCLEPRHFLLA